MIVQKSRKPLPLALVCDFSASPARLCALLTSVPPFTSMATMLCVFSFTRPQSSAFPDLLHHRFAEQPIQPRLVAFPLPAEPSHHVGVQAHRELLFHRPIKGIADGVFPEALGERWNLGKVDFRIRPLRKPGQLALASGRHRTVSQRSAHESAHNVFAPSGWLGVPRS